MRIINYVIDAPLAILKNITPIFSSHPLLLPFKYLIEEQIHLLLQDAGKSHSGALDFNEFVDALKFVRYRRAFLSKHIEGLSSFIDSARRELQAFDSEISASAAEKKKETLLNFHRDISHLAKKNGTARDEEIKVITRCLSLYYNSGTL